MAAAQELPGRQLLIKFGDGETPEVFTTKCLINTDRGIVWSTETQRGVTPDCDNPEDPGWQWAEIDGLMATINGAGTLNIPDIPFFDTWFRSGESKNIQVWVGTVGYWPGAFKLSGWEVTGQRNGKAQASVTIESDGEVSAYVVA